MQEPENARSLGTALRYMTAAGMATQRAQRAFLAHRKAKQAGLILPAAEPVEAPANQNGTNEITHEPDRPATSPAAAERDPPECMNDFPRPVVGPVPERPWELCARIAGALGGPVAEADRLPPRAAALPGPHDAGDGRWQAPRRPSDAEIRPRAAAAG